MAGVVYLDTHVVAWLYSGQGDRLGEAVRAALDENDLCVSPMVALELTYLHEIGRVTAAADEVLAEMAARIGLAVCDVSLGDLVPLAVRQTWTRDPFDRLIVAHAAFAGRPLVTKDEAIRANYPLALWSEPAPPPASSTP